MFATVLSLWLDSLFHHKCLGQDAPSSADLPLCFLVNMLISYGVCIAILELATTVPG